MNFNKYKTKKKLKDLNLNKNNPIKKLIKKIKKSTGKNYSGKITVRSIGGGNKKLYRIIDFKRKIKSPGIVKKLEYDPYRSCHLALILYNNGNLSYILAPSKLKINSTINSKNKNEIYLGDTLKLKDIPLNMEIFNVELKTNKQGTIARSAGTFCKILKKFKNYCVVITPSKKELQLNLECKATIGRCSNIYKISNKK